MVFPKILTFKNRRMRVKIAEIKIINFRWNMRGRSYYYEFVLDLGGEVKERHVIRETLLLQVIKKSCPELKLFSNSYHIPLFS